MKAFLFPGQGSQHKGMGKKLLGDFKTLVGVADEILGYSITELCLEDPDGRLAQTQYTQPALFVVSALTHLKHFEETNEEPAYFAGHSLGEYTALFAAGVFDFRTTLELVAKRGEVMSQAKEGGMAAVVGEGVETIATLTAEQAPAIDVANYNSDKQVVVSGPKDSFEDFTPILEQRGFRVIPLQVSAAFHSRYMVAAREAFTAFLDTHTPQAPRIPVIANVTAEPYPEGAAGIRQRLADQITGSVRWADSMRRLRALGVDTIIEQGPGQVLTRLWKVVA
jgi:trans-AT polyketide synthase/acyltransferase/oxidoreductase domain-containing protein